MRPAGHNAGTAGRAAIARCGGFTLLEILVAVAILGTALLVLLEAHYVGVRLGVYAQEEVTMNNLLQQAVAQAEVEVLAGNAAGSGEFGARLEGFSYSFEAQQIGEDERVALFEVLVSVEGPEETRAMTLYVYDKAVSPW